MIIIVEGVDASGKDTLINNLSKLTNMEVVRGSSFEMSEEGVDKMFEESKKLLLEEKDLILNRSFYSNAVYGPMYDYPTMSDEQFRELNRIVEEVGCVYYLTAYTEVLLCPHIQCWNFGQSHLQENHNPEKRSYEAVPLEKASL